MFCLKCGAELEEGARFCTRCGTPVESNYAPSFQETQKTQELYEQEEVYEQDWTVKKKNSHVWIAVTMIVIVLAVCVSVCVAVGVLLKGRQKDTNQGKDDEDIYISELDDQESVSSADDDDDDDETELSMGEEETDYTDAASVTIAEEITTEDTSYESTTEEDTSSSIELTVLDQNGNAVSSAEIFMEANGSDDYVYHNYKGKTGSNGIFKIENCEAGTYAFTITAEGYEVYTGGKVNVTQNSDNRLTAVLKSKEEETTTEAPKETLDEFVGMEATYTYHCDFDMDGDNETLGIYQYEDQWGEKTNCQIWYEDETPKRLFNWENNGGNEYCIIEDPMMCYDGKGTPYIIINSSRRVAASYSECMILGLNTAGVFDVIYDENGRVTNVNGRSIEMSIETLEYVNGNTNRSYEDKTAYIENGQIKYVETNDDNTEDQYILPKSGSEYLTEKDLQDLSVEELRLARNEIYARHGREFTTQDLSEYFNNQSWYTPKYTPEEFDKIAADVLNKYELANLELIQAEEAKRK